ncbi:hypothetical protein [Novipirellula artificiosorum]|uniref:YHS domain protein n=1 Tax=Novipirellula artificiosorum TaxID=2528016 RepID=A0A5C6DMF8_9BACT|nr:hypothetical protein [Novipirellula artificiosorum]TWU37324.1 hypothetical protein Poly41_34540 [Novipirellula artificiosorum]
MLLKKIAAVLSVALIAGVTVFAAETQEVKLADIKCVVAPKAANAEKSAEYKDGKVYFCCGGCVGKFSKDTEKYTTKANHQLVATKQYTQNACPISGNALNPETATKVAGVSVSFCCNGCKGKVDSAEDDKKLEIVFSDKAFAKAFKKTEPKTE